MNTLLCPADESPHQRRALARFAAVQAVLQACQNGLSFLQALQQAAQQSWDGRHFAASTLEHWVYRYRHGRFAALQTRARSDKGISKALDPAAREALLALRRAHPHLTVRALAAELVRQGVLHEGAYSDSTLQQRLAEAGLDRRSLKAGAGSLNGPTKAFELPLPNLLWMADCMYGPTLAREGGGTQRTFLFALLDDCSRLCVHGQFYAHERVENFLDCLRQAIQTRGVPDKLYADNGAAFRSHHLQIVCATLGIRLLHCKPYHSWSKGKCERLIQTLQQGFESTLRLEGQQAHSLAELNQKLSAWIQTVYHLRPPASTGLSPEARYQQGARALRHLDPAVDIDPLFYTRLERTVRKDGTVRLDGQLYEVPLSLRALKVQLRLDPFRRTCIEVWYQDRLAGLARKAPLHLNAENGGGQAYAR